MIRINLLPSEYQELARHRQRIVWVGLSGATVFLGMVVFLGARIAYASKLEKKIKDLEQEFTQLQSVVSQIKQMEAARSVLQTKVNVIQTLNDKRLAYPVLFEDFLAQLPAGVWISSFETNPQPNGFNVTVQAKAGSNFAIANWIANLEGSPYFKSPQIGAISYADSGLGSAIASFTLTCNYEHAVKTGAG